jgi:type I restriction enzyme S subunit
MIRQDVKKIEDWELEFFKERVSLEYGKGLKEAERVHGNYPVYGSNGIVGHHEDYLINGPGIVVGRKGTVGAINFVDDNFWPIDTTYFIKTKSSKVNLKWLFYRLTTLNLSALNTATGVPGLNRNLVYTIPIKWPSLPEQFKIAEILSTVDEAIDKTEALIQKYQRIKQGLMQDLLTKGIDEKGNIRSEKTHKFKDSPLGRIPEEWEVVSLFDVCALINGRAFKPEEWSDAGLPIVRIENLNDYSANFNYCNFKVEQKYYIDSGDLLISWSGTPSTSFGIFFWKRGAAILNQHIFKVKLNKQMLTPNYFYFSYKKLLTVMIKSSHGGVGLQHITKEDLRQLHLLKPDRPEQSRIASILSQSDEAIQKEQTYKQKLLSLKRGLMEDLLTGKVRVNSLISRIVTP